MQHRPRTNQELKRMQREATADTMSCAYSEWPATSIVARRTAFLVATNAATVLSGFKGARAHARGYAALDPACARRTSAFIDGVGTRWRDKNVASSVGWLKSVARATDQERQHTGTDGDRCDRNQVRHPWGTPSAFGPDSNLPAQRNHRQAAHSRRPRK
jgi:hypothetical protein